MSQIESVEQAQVGSNTGSSENLSQQIWSTMRDGAEGNSSSATDRKSPLSEPKLDSAANMADSHLPLMTISESNEQTPLELQKQESGIEGEEKDSPKKHDGVNKPDLGEKPKPPVQLDKPDKPHPGDKPKPSLKPDKPGHDIRLKPFYKPEASGLPKPNLRPEPVGKTEF